jgi:hypothetical protein
MRTDEEIKEALKWFGLPEEELECCDRYENGEVYWMLVQILPKETKEED